MSDYIPRDYVIFGRMSPHLIPGFSPRMLISMAAGLIIGLFIFFGLGLIAHDETRAAMYSDRVSQARELTEGLYALKYEEGVSANAGDAEGLRIVEEMRERYLSGKTDEEISDLASKARASGLNAQSRESEIDERIDAVITVREASVPIFWRVILSCLPIAAASVLFVEMNGASLAGEIAQKVRNRRAVKTYVYRSS